MIVVHSRLIHVLFKSLFLHYEAPFFALNLAYKRVSYSFALYFLGDILLLAHLLFCSSATQWFSVLPNLFTLRSSRRTEL